MIAIGVALTMVGLVAAAILVNNQLATRRVSIASAKQSRAASKKSGPNAKQHRSDTPESAPVERPARKSEGKTVTYGSMTGETVDVDLDAFAPKGWKKFIGPGLVPDENGNALPEWRDASGDYSIIKLRGSYVPSHIWGKEHREVSSQEYFVTFDDAAMAIRDYKFRHAQTNFGFLGVMPKEAKGSRSVRPAKPRSADERSAPAE